MTYESRFQVVPKKIQKNRDNVVKNIRGIVIFRYLNLLRGYSNDYKL